MEEGQTKVDEKTDKSLPSEELESALMYAMDTFDAAQLEFFLMGKTAEQIYKGEWLQGNKIELGVKSNWLSTHILDMLKIVEPTIDIGDRKIIIECNGVPIEIKIIKLHYRVLDNLDTIDYAYESFLIPNPFEAFLVSGRFMH